MKQRVVMIALLAMFASACAVGFAAEAKPKKDADKARAAKRAADKKREAIEAADKQLKAIERRQRETQRKNAAARKRRLLINQKARGAVRQRDNANNIRNLENQFRPQFEGLLKIELAFVQRVCELSDKQRKALSVGGDGCLKYALKAYVTAQGGRGRQVFFGNNIRVLRNGQILANGIKSSAKQPRLLIQDSVADLVKKTLRPEQTARYSEELVRRNENRVRAIAQFLVAMLDERLILEAEQREKLTESLVTNWQESWGQTAEMLMQNNQMNVRIFPTIPDRLVRSHLTKTQRSTWFATTKMNNRGRAFGIGGGESASCPERWSLMTLTSKSSLRK